MGKPSERRCSVADIEGKRRGTSDLGSKRDGQTWSPVIREEKKDCRMLGRTEGSPAIVGSSYMKLGPTMQSGTAACRSRILGLGDIWGRSSRHLG